MAIIDPVAESRKDHNEAKDLVFNAVSSIRARDMSGLRASVHRLDALLGPHYRFEEEGLYPAFKETMGEYIDRMVKEHTACIGAVATCIEAASREGLSGGEAGRVTNALMTVLVHMSGCEAVLMAAEDMGREERDSLGRCYERARRDAVGLLEWARTMRE